MLILFILGDRHMAICYITNFTFSYILNLKNKLHSQQNYPVL